MDYEQRYTKFIKHCQRNPPTGYSERHHILPRCLGGPDTDENIVRMTFRQHRHAHYLLYKIYKAERPSLIFAITAFYERPLRKGERRVRAPAWVRRKKTTLGAQLVREFIRANQR